MQTKLSADHEFFERLSNESPPWWNNLKSDPDVYIDIRKDNSLNAYHNGGCIMKLAGAREYKAQIHFEYIPINKSGDYLAYKFDNGSVSLNEQKTIAINDFDKESLELVKKRIIKFYPNDSEKGIQGRYVIKNNRQSDAQGFFIDTEFQFSLKIGNEVSRGRIDLVWVDMEKKQIVFIELKTITSESIYELNCS